MFNKILAYIFAICLLGSSALHAKDNATVKFPKTLKVGETELTLKGVGERSKFFVEVYLGGLYSGEKISDAKMLVKSNEAMAIRLLITSNLITSEKMAAATREGFEKSTDGNVASIKYQVDKFIEVFKESIEKNDAYNIIYLQEEGVSVYKNDQLKIKIKGLEFKEALFGIWLGDDPVDDDLKLGMLGEG